MSRETDKLLVHERIAESRSSGKFLLDIVAANFDVERLVEDYRTILDSYAIKSSPRADGSTLHSISLTHRPDATEPVYDGNNTQYNPTSDEKLFLEKDFSVFNEDFGDTIFYEIYRQAPFNIGRMRLNLLPPLTVF